MADPLLDDNPVLGTCCHVEILPGPRRAQRDAYAGQDGYTLLDCGASGGRVQVRGVLEADSLEDLVAVEALLNSFSDGQLHALTDTRGRTWPYCYFGEYRPSPDGPVACIGGWCLPYTLTLESLY